VNRVKWVALTMLLGVGLVACGGPVRQEAALGPPARTAAACPTPDAHVAMMGEPPGRHRIPSDFGPSWVLRCLIMPGPAGSAGSVGAAGSAGSAASMSVLVTERADVTAAEGASLVRLLSQPDDPPSSNGCPQSAVRIDVLVSYFALVDAQGKALLPGLPVDRCGRPDSAAAKALAALKYQVQSRSPIG
jgi:hypothetical protein